MTVESKSTTPWYRQFWPWFLIALPATVVVAGLSMVVVAFKYADPVINDNYYKDGLAINQTLAEDEKAEELGITAKLDFDTVTGEVIVDVAGKLDGHPLLDLMLMHPVDEKSDRLIPLVFVSDGRYRADLDSLPLSRFYLRLQPRSGGEWRLNGELDFRHAHRVTLTPDV